jgi:acetyl esterase/lipase
MPPCFITNSASEIIPTVGPAAFAAKLDLAGVANEYVVVPGGDHGNGYKDVVIAGTNTTVWQAMMAFLDTYIGAAT